MDLTTILIISFAAAFTYFTSSLKGYVLKIWGFEFIKTAIFEKNGKKVVLAGMSHVASSHFYHNIHNQYKSIKDGNKTAVLFEGVTDNDNLFDKTSVKYNELSRIVKLETQDNKFLFDQSEMVHADVDASSMQPTDIKLINWLFGALKSLIEASQYKGKEVKEFQLDSSLLDKNKMKEEDLNSLIYDRNNHLFKTFQENEAKYSVLYMPWGAKHLPDMQEKIEAMGYKEVNFNYIYAFNSLGMLFNFMIFIVKVQFFQSNVKFVEKKN